jgi:capsular polysaccharide export protein
MTKPVFNLGSGTVPDADRTREKRAFVFLQGPPGPLLHQLAQSMRSRGVAVERINICAGDKIDWPEPATNFRDSFRSWPVFFDNFLRKHGITDILLFGDCRPYHVTARRLAELRGIRTHVLEEGYLRPHWMTLELGGVNGYSPLNRCSKWFLDQARQIRPEGFLPPVTASFRRRVRDTARHYIAVHAGALAYPNYKTHRADPPLIEGFGWIWKAIRNSARARSAEKGLEKLGDASFFLLPLQLSGDYQIRNHSPFPDMPAATSFVLESFAVHAERDVHLLIKAHPLESSFFPWGRFIAKRARQLGISDRVHFVDGGDLSELAGRARGMVCVNSTSGTLALAAGTPVCTLGDAIYNVPGLTFGGHLDEFWIDPPQPTEGLYQAFRKVLVDRCLVRGGLASESAVATLVESMTERLCGQATLQSVESNASAFAK